MRITRDAEKSFQLAARPTYTPSKWLLRFVKVDNEDLYQLCIADAIATTGLPVLLTFTEVTTGAVALDAEVTLPPGQWQMYVYEQSSTTNLNWTLADRLVHEVLVEVVGAASADPEPTDPCSGSGDLCELLAADTDPLTTAACVTDANAPAMGSILLQAPTYTADLIVEHIGNASKTEDVQALICDAACPYDGIIQINGVQVGTFGPFDPCVDNTLNIVLT